MKVKTKKVKPGELEATTITIRKGFFDWDGIENEVKQLKEVKLLKLKIRKSVNVFHGEKRKERIIQFHGKDGSIRFDKSFQTFQEQYDRIWHTEDFFNYKDSMVKCLGYLPFIFIVYFKVKDSTYVAKWNKEAELPQIISKEVKGIYVDINEFSFPEIVDDLSEIMVGTCHLTNPKVVPRVSCV